MKVIKDAIMQSRSATFAI